MDWLPALLALTAMEIVLGIDNVIFLTIVAGRLPPAQQPSARRIGLILALGTRLLLLFSLSYLMRLTAPLFTLPALPFFQAPEAREISGRDLILIAGGLFLIVKATREVHHELEGGADAPAGTVARRQAGYAGTLVQIAVLDIIFSLDSVITAVGMSRHLAVMVAAMVAAVGVMMFAAGPIGNYVHRHPTLKMLALSFLVLIGVLLVADGFGQHVDKGYVYFAMAFSLLVELMNMRVRKAGAPVKLHQSYVDADAPVGTTRA
jgi:predicted tellurium resistance membrane protein TerC